MQLQAVEVRALLSGALRILVTVILGYVFIRLGGAVINRAVEGGYGNHRTDPRRVHTIASLLRSVLRYSIDFAVFTSVLDIAGISASSVLAGAGIIGLAIGFGAQSLVKDIIAGVFILFEDQYSVGDYVTISGVTGTVEEIGLRVTKIRAAGGELHVIPNGAIDRTANMSRGDMIATVDIPVSSEESITRISAILTGVAETVASTAKGLREGPALLGPISMSELAVVFRITARTEPLQHWAVERQIRAGVKEAFEREGIRPPRIQVVQK